MRNLILVSVLIGLVLIGGVLLVFYYLQPFDEEISFVKSINLSAPYDNTNNPGQDVIKRKIGTLNLDNSDGYFSQKYIFPNIIGCIDLKDDTQVSNQIRVTFENDGLIFYGSNGVDIEVGDEIEYDLYGNYNYYEKLNIVDIKHVTFYESKTKEYNPINDPYYYGRYNGNDCYSLAQNSKKVATIYLV